VLVTTGADANASGKASLAPKQASVGQFEIQVLQARTQGDVPGDRRRRARRHLAPTAGAGRFASGHGRAAMSPSDSIREVSPSWCVTRWQRRPRRRLPGHPAGGARARRLLCSRRRGA
jgi:hypothetical protein